MGSLYLWGHSIQVMGGDVVIDHSIYGVVVIDGSLYSRFYGMHANECNKMFIIHTRAASSLPTQSTE